MHYLILPASSCRRSSQSRGQKQVGRARSATGMSLLEQSVA